MLTAPLDRAALVSKQPYAPARWVQEVSKPLGLAWQWLKHGGGGAWKRMAEPLVHSDGPLFSDHFDGEAHCKNSHLDLLVTMVPSVRDENVQIVGTLFRAETATSLVDLSKMETYFKVTLSNSYSRQKCFPTVYSMSVWCHLQKVMFFEIVCELTVKSFTSFYMQGQLGLGIRIRDHSWTHLDATNLMIVSELANELLLKITFFEVSPIVSVCVKFQ